VKKWMVLLSSLLLLMTLGAAVQAATPYKTPAAAPAKTAPAAFAIEGKILKLAKGQFQVQVVRVEKAAAIKAGEKLWIRESAKTKILSAGKAVSAGTLKVGNTVEISGDVMISGTKAAYDALSVQIVASR
jgi:hypothetical protein